MTKNKKAEIALNNAAAPAEQKSPFGAGVEGTVPTPCKPATATTTAQPSGPPQSCDRMLRFPDVLALTGLSRTTIWRRVKAGTFPAPLSLGENSCGWPENQVHDWVNNRPVVSYAPEAA